MSEITQKDREPKSYFYVNKVKCPYDKCKKKTEVFLYVMVGANIDVKSLYGALCEDHATKIKERLVETWDITIEKIDDINERIRQKYYPQEEEVKLNNK